MAFLECAVYTVFPTLLGWILHLIVTSVSGSTVLFYYGAPVVLFIVWFWAGKRYRTHLKNPVLAILAGNSVGLLSMAVYLWQEYLTASKIEWLEQLAQYFTAPLTALAIPIVAQFSPTVDGVTQVSNTALQAVGFLLTVLAFCGGYFYEKNRQELIAQQKISK